MNTDHEAWFRLSAAEREVLEECARLRGLTPPEALRAILAEWDLLRRLGLLNGTRPLGVRWQLMLYCAELPEPLAELFLQHFRAPEAPPSAGEEAEIAVIRRALRRMRAQEP